MRKTIMLTAVTLLAASAQADTLFSNGPVVNAQGLSILAPGHATLGVGVQSYYDNKVADDFTVGAGGWVVTDLDFFAHNNLFAFTDVAWSIVTGGTPANGVVVASGTTAVTNGGFLGYRVTASNPGGTTMKIYDIKADIPDVALSAGSYWLTWSLGATNVLEGWGPWQNPVSGNSPIGNSMQSFNAGGGNFPWVTVRDPGANVGLSLPFQINGSVGAVPEPATALALGAGLLALMRLPSVRRRLA